MGEKSKEKKQSSGHLSEEIENDIENLPKMELAQLRFLLKTVPQEHDQNKEKMMTFIKENSMAPYYEALCEEFEWQVDSSLLNSMKTANDNKIKELEEQLKDANENLGDLEVLEAHFATATVYSRIGDTAKALKSFEEAAKRPQTINQKIQVALHKVRLGLFNMDNDFVKDQIAIAKKLIDEGGDWDRRNRLKVYEGCYLMLARDFEKSAALLQESVATFTSTELMNYKQMIYYCVIMNVLTCSRVLLKKNIVDCPEILSVIQNLPHLSNFMEGLYKCEYKQFFQAIVGLNDSITRDMYLSGHKKYIYRELRVLAYSQFLEAYRSVTMASMANAFGITMDFLDSELSRFISAGRLNAKIDKVGGVVETNRPDAKNAQYQQVIKKGDLLLNRVQKLARVINV